MEAGAELRGEGATTGARGAVATVGVGDCGRGDVTRWGEAAGVEGDRLLVALAAGRREEAVVELVAGRAGEAGTVVPRGRVRWEGVSVLLELRGDGDRVEAVD